MLSKLKFSPLILIIILIIGLSSIGIFLFSERAGAVTEIRHHRNSSITVNGLTAKELGTTNTATSAFLDFITSMPGECVDWNATWSSDVIIRHANGTETVIATNVAPVTRTFFTNRGEGYQSASWNAPAISLSPTDAIKIVERITPGDVTRAWVTGQLNASQLNAGAWTFTRFTSLVCGFDGQMGMSHYFMRLHYGSPTHNTRIENFSFTPHVPHVDCGLRVFDGVQTVAIACEPLGTLTSPLRIARHGNIHGVVIVDIADPNASRIRIQTTLGIRALRRF